VEADLRLAPTILFTASLCVPAFARDTGQWTHESAQIRAWFQSLMQPDAPVSCCGSGDGYYADAVSVQDGRIIATVTDSRGNSIPVGTKVVVPPNKINKDPNMTGHTIIFLGGIADAPIVYCFITATGV
jgi:hypothetical protein